MQLISHRTVVRESLVVELDATKLKLVAVRCSVFIFILGVRKSSKNNRECWILHDPTDAQKTH